uniref:Uncharacterized protein n=1 Tax=Oryza brachyantha TaxID=4533 RepID=J3MDE6_ORYBR
MQRPIPVKFACLLLLLLHRVPTRQRDAAGVDRISALNATGAGRGDGEAPSRAGPRPGGGGTAPGGYCYNCSNECQRSKGVRSLIHRPRQKKTETKRPKREDQDRDREIRSRSRVEELGPRPRPNKTETKFLGLAFFSRPIGPEF